MIILCGQAGVTQIAIYAPPVLYATVVEEAYVLSNDKRHMTTLKTLPKQQQTPYTTVAVLEWVYALKENVEVQYIVKLDLFDSDVIRSQGFHLFMNILG